LSWTAPVGVSIGSYRVYRTTTSGLYGANSYLGATASPVYTDTALATTTIPAVLTPITATINQLPIFDTLLDDIVII
jgi:hypothetical protein